MDGPLYIKYAYPHFIFLPLKLYETLWWTADIIIAIAIFPFPKIYLSFLNSFSEVLSLYFCITCHVNPLELSHYFDLMSIKSIFIEVNKHNKQ